MDGQEYLNRISTKNQVAIKKKRSGIFSSVFFWVGLVGVVGLLLIIVLGSILGSAGSEEKTRTFRFLAHLENTANTVQEYQPNIKSSDLRSSSASFYSVLTNTNSEVMNLVSEKYGIKSAKDIDKNILEQATVEQDALNEELYKAKINGTLDRIYAHKMASEISTIMSQENDIYSATKNDELKSALDKSYNSLENLYNKFNHKD